MDQQTVKVALEEVPRVAGRARPAWESKYHLVIKCADGEEYRADHPTTVYVVNGGRAFEEAVELGVPYETYVGGVTIVACGGKITLNRVSPITLRDVAVILSNVGVYTSPRSILDHAGVHKVSLRYDGEWRVDISITTLKSDTVAITAPIEGSIAEIQRMLTRGECPQLHRVYMAKLAPEITKKISEAVSQLMTIVPMEGVSHDYPVLTIQSGDCPRIPSWLTSGPGADCGNEA